MRFICKMSTAAAAAGLLAMGAAVAADSGPGDCGGRPGMMRDNMRGAKFDPAAMADQRLSRLKSDLKITPEQEPLWQAFADRAKSEAGKGMQAMRDQAKDANLSAPERMNRMADLLKQRAAAVASVNEAFQRLYDGLTPEQRKLADQHAARMGRMGMERAGHHGPRRGPSPADATKG